MAEKIDELEVLITANTAQLKAGLKDVESKLSGVSKSAGSFGTALSAKAVAIGGIISNVFSKVFNEIAQNLDAGIQRLDTLNNFTKVMGNLGIESGIAQQAINKLSDELQGLPTSLSDAVSSVQRFTAVNNSLAYSTDAYLALNNAILASGASTQMQASALEQITQAYSKGKPEMQDWKTMIQTMPAQLKQVGLAMGYASTTELYDALQAGEITMQDFMDTVMKLNTEGVAGFASFAEQARGATGGVQTSITNLKIAIQRGIANIMNVLGQSNIAGFFNKIASAIGTASNYIAAFIKLIKQAVAWIGALFGKGGSTTETVKETGSAMGGVASGAGKVGDNLEKANGSAKKLKRTLAGFDEMNVLTESESGGSGSGVSVGGAGGIDMSDYTWDDSGFAEATDKIEEALQKIKNALKDTFGIIDFTKLGESIKKLKTGFDNLHEGIKLIGKELVDKFIAPLTKFALEETIPKMLGSIGDMLNTIDFGIMARGFSSFFTGLETIGEFLFTVLADVFDIVNKITANLINLTVPPALAVIGTVLQTIGTILRGIWDGIVKVWNGTIQPILDRIAENLQPIINLITEMHARLQENEEVWNAVRQVFEIIGEVVGEILLTPLRNLLSVIEFISEGVNILYGCLVQVLGITNESAEANINLGLSEEELKTKDEELRTEVEKLNGMYYDREEVMNRLAGSVQSLDKAEANLKTAEENLRKAEEETNTQIHLNDAEIQALEQSFLTTTSTEERLSLVAQAYGKDMTTQRDEVVRLYNEVNNSSDAMGQYKSAQERVNEMNKTLTTSNTNIQEQVNKVREEYKNAGLSADQMRDRLKELSESGEQGSEDLRVAIEDDMSNNTEAWGFSYGQMKAFSADAHSESLKNWNKTEEEYRNIGNKATQGMRNGTSSFGSIFSSLATNAINTFKNIFGIHSPSKVFQEFGGYLSEGLAIGIDDKAEDVEKSLSNLVDFSIPDFGIKTGIDLGITDKINDVVNKDPVHVTVNVGEDTLIDKVVDGINDLSNLKNGNILYV